MNHLNVRHAIPPLPKELADVGSMSAQEIDHVAERVRSRQQSLSTLRLSSYHRPSLYPLFLGGVIFGMGWYGGHVSTLRDNPVQINAPFSIDQHNLRGDMAATCGDVWLGLLRHTRL